MKKTLISSLAIAASILAVSSASVLAADGTFKVGNIAPVVGIAALEKVKIKDVTGDANLKTQVVGVTFTYESKQPVGVLNAEVANGGFVAGGLLAGPIEIEKVGGSASLGLTVVGAAVDVNQK